MEGCLLRQQNKSIGYETLPFPLYALKLQETGEREIGERLERERDERERDCREIVEREREARHRIAAVNSYEGAASPNAHWASDIQNAHSTPHACMGT